MISQQNIRKIRTRGGGTGEASEALASPEFRGFTTEKFLASWIYERGNFSCFTGKKLVPLPLKILLKSTTKILKNFSSKSIIYFSSLLPLKVKKITQIFLWNFFLKKKSQKITFN